MRNLDAQVAAKVAQDRAMQYIKRAVRENPVVTQADKLTDDVIVVNVEWITDSTLALDLSDNTTIRLDIERYPTGGGA